MLPGLLRESKRCSEVLNEEKSLLETLLLPQNYVSTHIVGEIITKKNPIKPKKKLIVTVAFVFGLILSIALVFLLEFVNSMRKKEEENK